MEAPMLIPPYPVPSNLSQPFWDGTRRGKFLLQKCGACGAYRWTPQWLCTKCHSLDFAWVEASGDAKVYSFSVVHRPPLPGFKAPYVVATVELAEGPMMLTNIVDCDPKDVKIDMKVKVTFDKVSDEISLYKFRPA